jgi:hypothetical protein
MSGEKQRDTIKFDKLNSLTPTILQLFNKNKREVQLNSLTAMLSLIKRYPSQFSGQAGTIQKELVKMIDESDVQRAAIALTCAAQIIQLNKGLGENGQILQ